MLKKKIKDEKAASWNNIVPALNAKKTEI